MRLFVDINKRVISRTLDGPVLVLPRFYQNDITALQISFADGSQLVTSTLLSGGQTFAVAIKAIPSSGTALVSNTGYSRVGEVATATLDLTASALANYISDFVPSDMDGGVFYLEMEITSADATSRETFALGAVMVVKDSVMVGSAYAGAPFALNTGVVFKLNDGTAFTLN